MKERPILFSVSMVRASLAGTKTQTRRVVKPQPADTALLPRDWGKVFVRREKPDIYGSDGTVCGNVPMADGSWGEVRCPYGQPGDRLWVREAFRLCAEADATPPRDTNAAYRVWYEADAPHQPGFGKLRQSMFMPRWASRITLEITGIRVERLKDISEADAIAEGIAVDECGHAIRENDPINWGGARTAYSELWESINGQGSWAANPWVWCVEFKRVEQ